MNFEELRETYKATLYKRGDYKTDAEQYTIVSILDGYRSLQDAQDDLETFGDRELVRYTVDGYAIDPDALRVAIAKATPDHSRQMSKSGRQVCCYTCHTCGEELQLVLDGELWCENCKAYR